MTSETAMTDEVLMLAYRGGDARAFDTLYTRYKGPLYRYLLRQCHVPAVAEELFQDIWFNLIRARERYEPRAKFSTFIYSMAHNRLIDHYRKSSRSVPISYDDDPDDAPLVERVAGTERDNPAWQAEIGEQSRQLRELLAELPEAQREAFLLREEGDLSVEEIAAATGVNAETAKSRLRYAVAKLRQGMTGRRKSA
ncbi:MAG: RNA polymerase sigma factor [Pseudomonadota bacterium]